jgi:hypothetical protein
MYTVYDRMYVCMVLADPTHAHSMLHEVVSSSDRYLDRTLLAMHRLFLHHGDLTYH